MNFQERLADIRARMRDEKVDLLVGLHDGAHFIEKPNPVMVLSGFKSLGPAAALLAPDGAMTLIVTPHWDAERAAQCCPDARVVGVDNVVEGVLGEVEGNAAAGTAIGIAGLRFLPYDIASHLTFALPGARSADKLVFDAARAKTADEIASAREATRIAERGYEHLLEIARPGMSEDELAVELKWFMKTLGAEDNFLLLCAGPHNRAVAAFNRPQARDGRHHPRRDHAELPRPARADLPHRRARRAVPGARATSTRSWCARWTKASRPPCRALPWPRSAAPSTRCWRPKAMANTAIRRISAGAATASASARSGRATSRSTTPPCSSPTWCS